MLQKAMLSNDDTRQDVPSLRNILALRKLSNGQGNEGYIFFCMKFLKCVVGVQNFKRGIKNKLKMSTIASPSDEALTLLLLENSEYRWTTELERKMKGEEVNEDTLHATKYTSAGQNKKQLKGFTRKYGGWLEEGIERFNELVEMVKADREENGKWFDDIVAQRRSDEDDNDDIQMVKGSSIKAANDLFDDVEDDDEDEDHDDVECGNHNFAEI